jgi:hypothetical protein
MNVFGLAAAPPAAAQTLSAGGSATAIIAAVLIAGTVLKLDSLELSFLNRWNIGRRIGALLMITVGAIASTTLGIASILGWAARMIVTIFAWIVCLIPLPPSWDGMPHGTATAIGTGLIMLISSLVVVRLILGLLPTKVSTRNIDWKEAYMAVFIPAVLTLAFPPLGRSLDGAIATLTNTVIGSVTGMM